LNSCASWYGPHHIALLVNPLSPAANIEIEDMDELARASEFRLLALQAKDEGEWRRRSRLQFAIGRRIADQRGPVLLNTSRSVVALAARCGLPVMYPWQQYPEIGGLMSYGPIS